jgi:U32 family peptidase
VGTPLRVVATTATGIVCRFESPEALPEAAKHPLTVETLTEQFGRLGKTPYELRRLDAKIDGRPMVPLSVLGKLRRELVEQLDAASARPPSRTLAEGSALATLRAEGLREIARAEYGVRSTEQSAQIASSKSETRNLKSEINKSPNLQLSKLDLPHLHVLCRSLAQIEAALACGVSSVIVDFHNLRRCAKAVQAIQAGGAKALLATPRIHKPGESNVFELLAKSPPDGILVRNLAGLAFFRSTGLPIVADFSLNAVNELTIDWLRAIGAQRITVAYDLGRQRLLNLATAVPAEWLEFIVHRYAPLFHSEHCVFCRTLSPGKNNRDCGRPCERHTLRLRDRLGVEHLLLADSQCRNTLFHAESESLAELVPSLQEQGVRHFRVELLAESCVEEVRRVIEPFRRVLTLDDRRPSDSLPVT